MLTITKKMRIFVADLADNSQKSCNLQPFLSYTLKGMPMERCSSG